VTSGTSEKKAVGGAGSGTLQPGSGRHNAFVTQSGSKLIARRSLVVNVVVTAITIAALYLALRHIDLADVWHALRVCDFLWLIPALVAFGLATFARALRWRSLFAPDHRPPRSTVMNATMLGYFYNSILPVRAGEAARVVVLTQRSSAPAAEVVGTVIVERLYDLTAILVIFFATEPWMPPLTWLKAAAIAAAALAVLIAGAATLLAVYGDRPVRMLLKPLTKVSAVSESRLERMVRELANGFAWTLIAWMLSALCAYFVTLAFHLQLPFLASVLVVVAVGFGMIVPSPPAAVGVFEGAVLVALKVYGVSSSSALPYALVLHAVNFVPFVVVGLFLLQFNARNPKLPTAIDVASPPAPEVPAPVGTEQVPRGL
jgi:glycosyltransferase 2 family protein